MPPRAVIFDLYGVLLDSRVAIVRCIEHGLRAHGVAVPPAVELERFIGPPLVEARHGDHAARGRSDAPGAPRRPRRVRGTPAANLELSKRRARAVKARLDEKKLGARVTGFVGGTNPSGCERLEFGMRACGEGSAAPEEARPEDRKVSVLFLRNAPVGTGPLDLLLKPPAP
jgi:hypothetical protein